MFQRLRAPRQSLGGAQKRPRILLASPCPVAKGSLRRWPATRRLGLSAACPPPSAAALGRATGTRQIAWPKNPQLRMPTGPQRRALQDRAGSYPGQSKPVCRRGRVRPPITGHRFPGFERVWLSGRKRHRSWLLPEAAALSPRTRGPRLARRTGALDRLWDMSQMAGRRKRSSAIARASFRTCAAPCCVLTVSFPAPITSSRRRLAP